MFRRLQNSSNELIDSILNIGTKSSWKEESLALILQVRAEQTITEEPSHKAKRATLECIKQAFKQKITEGGKEKSKVKFLLEQREDWTPGKNTTYMDALNRKQCSLIFKARTRMLDVKNNFRSKCRDEICRGCGKEKETQQHILEECTAIHDGQKQVVKGADIFTEEITTLKNTAEKIDNIMAKIAMSERQEPQHTTGRNAQPGDPGQHST